MFSILPLAMAFPQGKAKIYASLFVPDSVVFNGSPNPNECWESVAWGIKIETERGNQFFLLSFEAVKRLQDQIGGAKVEIEVNFYTEPDSINGAAGYVKTIKLNDKIIYDVAAET